MGLFDFINDNNMRTKPNLKTPTMGGKVFWIDINELSNGYKIQKHIFDSNHYRVLDKDNKRVAWGTKKQVNRFVNHYIDTTKKYPQRGDIVAVDRGNDIFTAFQHFAVYLGDYRVIHYSKRDISSKACICNESFDAFIKKSKNFYILEFDRFGKGIWQRKGNAPQNDTYWFDMLKHHFSLGDMGNISKTKALEMFNEIYECLDDSEFHLFSAEETVKRAESKLNQEQYNLLTNNCEHFAIWCKTGLHKSEQIDSLLKAKIRMEVDYDYFTQVENMSKMS